MLNAKSLYYWIDKERHEIDFIIKNRGGEAHTIECKINPVKKDF